MKHIGKYEILGLLGVGGMGKVYKVRLPKAGRVVALKLLQPREELEMLLGEEEVEDRFLAELKLMGGLRDPNVVGVLDVDRDQQGRWFYTMDYFCLNLGLLLGETYESDQPSRTLPVDTAVRYGLHLLSGLEHLHHHGVVHRDIKPFNLLIGPGDVLKIIDFGLSKVRHETRHAPGGLKIGTPFYAAPEQEDDAESVDARADLFSAGVVIWRMLTGCMVAERASERVAPSTQAPHLGEAFDEVLQRAVAFNPDRRFASAQAMAVAMRDAHEDWKEHLANACVLLEEDGATQSNGSVLPRAKPMKVRAGQAADVFPVDDLMRPKTALPRDFEVAGDGLTVRHGATGLTWQRAGSSYGLEFARIPEYLDDLNAQGFGGRSDWRLPTVDELMTLLSPPRELTDYCSDPVFERRQRWLWSADAKSFMAGWFVDAHLGFAAFADHTCPFFVRAVSGPVEDRAA